jgi:hypothetical protein
MVETLKMLKRCSGHAPTLQRFNESRVWFRFAEAGDLVAGLALTALFEERRAFKTLEDIALAAQGGGRAETAML